MQTRNVTLLAVAVVILVVAGTTVAVTHPQPLGLHRQTGAPVAPPPVNQPMTPPAAAAGTQPGPTRQAASGRPAAARDATGGQKASLAASRSPAANGSYGAATCPTSATPATTPYAWECTRSDGTPARWRSATITFWAGGLTAAQTQALQTAAGQWTAHIGIALVPASSAASAQLVLSEVSTLDALPDLGSDVVEYALTQVHQTAGYYDHATIQVADVPMLGADTWLDTMLHELGHVAGLGHVADQSQIMRQVVGVPQTTYGDGDVAGLETERPR